jgi:hypothetical protein
LVLKHTPNRIPLKSFLNRQTNEDKDSGEEFHAAKFQALYMKYASPEAWKTVAHDEYAKDMQAICPYSSFGSYCRSKCAMAKVCRSKRCPGSCGKGVHVPIVCYHYLYEDGECKPDNCQRFSHDAQRKQAILQTPYHDIGQICADVEKNHNLFPLDAIDVEVEAEVEKGEAEGKLIGESSVTDSEDDPHIKLY